ncbi:MAG: phosphopyruvate hydratase [Sphingopyxis sp.]|jgi:enolase|uniref:phosphopyruvate hydratase n=1 Tax=Sphingopyxis sp. TaxID=1908224 RepID=UPI003F701371
MNPDEIVEVRGRRVWDSRGRPTIEAEVHLRGGAFGRAIAPAGASCGAGEAIDLRDGGDAFGGLGVQHALCNIADAIAPALRGLAATDQAAVDRRLEDIDGTANFACIGGNAAVATSLAVLHAAAASKGMPLWQSIADTFGTTPSIPLPEIQIFGGGAHAAARVAVQDFMIMVPGADGFDEALAITAEVYRAAGAIMAECGPVHGVADEGGWWPDFDSNEDALDTLVRAIERAGQVPGDKVVISLDIAATQFARAGSYALSHGDAPLSEDAMIDALARWVDRYPIVAVEDPLAETAEEGMVSFTQRCSEIQVVGDDFLTTNADRVRIAAAAGACNTALIKVNQAGTVSRTVAALKAAQAAGWGAIVSARSGETEDVSIAHLSVGLGAGQFKVGSFARGERTAKWNEVLRIAEQAGEEKFVGGAPLAGTWWNRDRKE